MGMLIIIYHALIIVIDYTLILSACVFQASSLRTSASDSLLSVFCHHRFFPRPDGALRGDVPYSCFTDTHKLALIF